MASSPDLTGFVDLRPYDVDIAGIINRALTAAAAKMPGWVPREGNTEVVLVEALALEVAEVVYAINRVPAAVTMQLLGLYGITKDPGVDPVATVTVTAIDDHGYNVPAGTMFRLDDVGLLAPLYFTVDADTAIPNGSTSIPVPVTGTTANDEANGVPAGTALSIVSSLYFAESAVLATDITGGVYPEDDVRFLNRGVERLQRLTDTLVLPSHFTARALEEVDVTRATTLDLYDPGTGPAPGSNPGHVTVAVYGAGGTLSGPRKTAIAAAMQSQALANLTIHVVDPTITVVAVTAGVHVHAGYDPVAVVAAATAAVDAYLDPAAWDWAGTVRRNELISLLDQVEGVDYVASLTLPAADVVLAGVANLADAGVITITSA